MESIADNAFGQGTKRNGKSQNEKGRDMNEITIEKLSQRREAVIERIKELDVLKDELIVLEDEILSHIDCPYPDGWNNGGFSRNSLVATTRHVEELQKMETARNTDDFTVSEWNMLFEATVADGGIPPHAINSEKQAGNGAAEAGNL
jgi:hypothetical protein